MAKKWSELSSKQKQKIKAKGGTKASYQAAKKADSGGTKATIKAATGTAPKSTPTPTPTASSTGGGTATKSSGSSGGSGKKGLRRSAAEDLKITKKEQKQLKAAGVSKKKIRKMKTTAKASREAVNLIEADPGKLKKSDAKSIAEETGLTINKVVKLAGSQTPDKPVGTKAYVEAGMGNKAIESAVAEATPAPVPTPVPTAPEPVAPPAPDTAALDELKKLYEGLQGQFAEQGELYAGLQGKFTEQTELMAAMEARRLEEEAARVAEQEKLRQEMAIARRTTMENMARSGLQAQFRFGATPPQRTGTGAFRRRGLTTTPQMLASGLSIGAAGSRLGQIGQQRTVNI